MPLLDEPLCSVVPDYGLDERALAYLQFMAATSLIYSAP